jgi:hypothetical protein
MVHRILNVRQVGVREDGLIDFEIKTDKIDRATLALFSNERVPKIGEKVLLFFLGTGVHIAEMVYDIPGEITENYVNHLLDENK